MLNDIQKKILQEVADMTGIPDGAVNIRSDGQKEYRQNSEHITIESKTDKDGIDIRIAPFTKNENVHIPVVLTKSGFQDMVYNDFFVGEGADVRIVAGCGIHNCGDCDSQHDGIHTFYVGKNAKVTYIEKHYGEGEGRGKRILNPQTIVYLEEGASIVMETSQIAGVDDTKRYTKVVAEGADSEVQLHAAVLSARAGQRPVLRPCLLRRDHHERGKGARHSGDLLQPRRREPHPRGGHRPYRGRAAAQARDARPDAGGSGGKDSGGFPALR